MRIVHSALSSHLFYNKYSLLARSHDIVVLVALCAFFALEFLQLLAICLDKLITRSVSGCRAGSLLSHSLFQRNIKGDDIVIVTRCSCSVQIKLILQISLGRSEFVALFSNCIHTSQHHIYSCDCVGDALSDLSENLCGNRNDIHDRVCPAVVISRFDDLNINLLDTVFLFSNKPVQHLFADSHVPVHRDIVVLSPLHISHMECFDHKAA